MSTGRPLRASVWRHAVDVLRPAATPARPAVVRLGVGAFAAWNGHRRRDLVRGLHRQDPRRFEPVGVVKVLKRPLPPRVADGLFDAAQAVNALATLGVAHRVTGPLNAALQLWTLSYRNSWGMLFHNDNMLLMHQMVLGVSPSADALSVDAAVAGRGLAPAVLERRYGGVLPMVNAATCVVYLISGVAKVRSELGVKWAGGDVLRGQIAIDGLRKELFGSEMRAAGRALYRQEHLFTLMATVALAVELGAPLSLVDRRLGRAFAVAAWGMHVGIRVIMGIKFTYNTSGVSYLGYFPVGPALPR